METIKKDHVGIIYVGAFATIEARFVEHGDLRLQFKRGEVKFVEPEVAALFEPNQDWIIGVKDWDGSGILGRARRVLVRRSVALGDVIAVHGALQGIMRAYPGDYQITFQTNPQYVEMLRSHPTYVDVIPDDQPLHRLSEEFDHVVCLDAVLEKDHAPDGEKISRVFQSWRHFFMTARSSVVNVPEHLRADFSLVVPEVARAWAWRTLNEQHLADTDKPLIAVATRSVQNPRNLGEGYVREFTETLTARWPEAEVILIDHDPKHLWESTRIRGFPGTSIVQALAILQHCDVLCSMDSGAMWMGHTTPIPEVLWFGPTPPETKCNYHPFYPDGVRALKMWEWVECPASCYEAAEWCNFEFACMKRPPKDRFIEESIQGVRELFDWNRKHGREIRRKVQEVYRTRG